MTSIWQNVKVAGSHNFLPFFSWIEFIWTPDKQFKNFFLKIRCRGDIRKICDSAQSNTAWRQTLRRLTLRRVKLRKGYHCVSWKILSAQSWTLCRLTLLGFKLRTGLHCTESKQFFLVSIYRESGVHMWIC